MGEIFKIYCWCIYKTFWQFLELKLYLNWKPWHIAGDWRGRGSEVWVVTSTWGSCWAVWTTLASGASGTGSTDWTVRESLNSYWKVTPNSISHSKFYQIRFDPALGGWLGVFHIEILRVLANCTNMYTIIPSYNPENLHYFFTSFKNPLKAIKVNNRNYLIFRPPANLIRITIL